MSVAIIRRRPQGAPAVSQIAFLGAMSPKNLASSALGFTTASANDCVWVAARSANGVNTIPTPPAGWTAPDAGIAIGTSMAARLAYKTGSGTSNTGTWTGASWIVGVGYSGIDTADPMSDLDWITDAAPSPFDFDVPAIGAVSPYIDWAVELITWRASVTIEPTASFTERTASTNDRMVMGDTNGPLLSTIALTNHTATGSVDPVDVISARFRINSM